MSAALSFLYYFFFKNLIVCLFVQKFHGYAFKEGRGVAPRSKTDFQRSHLQREIMLFGDSHVEKINKFKDVVGAIKKGLETLHPGANITIVIFIFFLLIYDIKP